MWHSGALLWCMQRVSSLSLLALVGLLYLALLHSPSYHPRRHDHPADSRPATSHRHRGRLHDLTNSQLLLVCYTVLAHVFALVFPIRLCWATWRLTRNLKAVLQDISEPDVNRGSKPCKKDDDYELSFSSRSSMSDIDPYVKNEPDNELVEHAIIIPNYQEDIDTLRDTLEVLACHPQASSTYSVYLAMEQGEKGSDVKAATLIKEYGALFRSLDSTMHPRDIPGEAPGKSSNLRWAARYVNGRYKDGETKENTIVTVIDADSYLSTNYFRLVTDAHIAHPDTAGKTVYVPPIIFDRNAHRVPTLVRVADLTWCGAGLSGHYEDSSITPPTSVYSIPLTLVDRVGGWDAGVEAIGEDLHMYIKCFFALNGNLTARTVFSAASQSNIHQSDMGIRGFLRVCKARYRQALRHMWGALDSGYVLKSVLHMVINGRNESRDRPHWTNTLVLLHRMYEAHFLPTHLALLILSVSLYTLLTPISGIPPTLLLIVNATANLRILSLVCFALFFFLYEPYHNICIKTRKQEMARAGLADRMSAAFSNRKLMKNCLDYCAFPISGVLFGSLPALVALVCHFWTLKLVYKVSKKPPRVVHSSPA